MQSLIINQEKKKIGEQQEKKTERNNADKDNKQKEVLKKTLQEKNERKGKQLR